MEYKSNQELEAMTQDSSNTFAEDAISYPKGNSKTETYSIAVYQRPDKSIGLLVAGDDSGLKQRFPEIADSRNTLLTCGQADLKTAQKLSKKYS